ncbi:MAG: PIN domain-containing protein [Bacteroidota bacterium]
MIDKQEFLVETDIIIDHLMQSDLAAPSALEAAMVNGVCFTSVITASELYFNCREVEEKNAVDSVLRALNVLGIHSRYSLNISDFFDKVATVRDALMCSLAKNNKLPILTNNFERFRRSGIEIISPNQLRG